MILKESEVKSATLGSQKSKQFGISDNKIIYDILRNKLYTNPKAAICREIASNSRDANREAGNGHVPIEIKITESFEDFGIVGDMAITFKDFGPGISPERMDEVFLIYGESTKRETNDFTGGLGLGAKTPFAYSDTFSIITVCEHKGKRTKYTYVAALDEKEKGTMHLFKSSKTEDHTGTEIIVPIKNQDRRNFEEHCISYTKYWDVLPKLTNFTVGFNPIKKYNFSGFDIWREDDCRSPYMAIVDGIPYETLFNSGGIHNTTIGFSFQNGVLDLGGGREYLQRTAANEKIISEKAKDFHSFAHNYLTEYFSKFKTYNEAIIAFNALNNSYAKSNNFYKNVNGLRDEEYLAYVFHSIYDFNTSRYSSKDNIFYWNKKPLSKVDFVFNEFSFANQHSFNSTYGKARTEKINPWSLLFSDNKNEQKKISIHIIDVKDKKLQRINTLVKKNSISFFFEEKVMDVSQNKEEETKKQRKKKLEEDLMEILFDVKKLSDVEPTNYNTASKKTYKKKTEPINVTFRKFEIDNLAGSHNRIDKIIKGKDKDKYSNVILIKASSIQETFRGSGLSSSDICSGALGLLMKYTIDPKIDVLAASVSYNTMIAHGAVPMEKALENLTSDQMKSIKKIIRWYQSPEILLRLAHIKSIEFDKQDSEILDLIKLDKITKDLSHEEIDDLIHLSEGIFKMSDYKFKKTLEPIKADGVDSIKEISDDIDKIKSILEKYPMLNFCRLNDKGDMSETSIAYINQYLKTVQTALKKSKRK